MVRLAHRQRLGMSVGPAVGFGLDLGPCDEFTGPVGQPQGLRDDEGILALRV
jgi:hypothetical protein